MISSYEDSTLTLILTLVGPFCFKQVSELVKASEVHILDALNAFTEEIMQYPSSSSSISQFVLVVQSLECRRREPYVLHFSGSNILLMICASGP